MWLNSLFYLYCNFYIENMHWDKMKYSTWHNVTNIREITLYKMYYYNHHYITKKGALKYIIIYEAF